MGANIQTSDNKISLQFAISPNMHALQCASSKSARLVTKIAPSMLSCNFGHMFEDGYEIMSKCKADWLHLDIMDGHFVDDITFGPLVINALSRELKNVSKSKPEFQMPFLDVHMMVTDPYKHVERIGKAVRSGENLDSSTEHQHQYTFHVEAVRASAKNDEEAVSKTFELIEHINANGMHAGVAIKPATPVDTVLPFISKLHMVLVMTVEPGKGGQSFMEDMMSKVQFLRNSYPSLNIQVDGGLSPATIDIAAKAGANVIVAGSAIFTKKLIQDDGSVSKIPSNAEERAKVISTLRKVVDNAGFVAVE